MTVAEDIESGPGLEAPALAMPPRPLPLLRLRRTGQANSLAICDEALFDELFVERNPIFDQG